MAGQIIQRGERTWLVRLYVGRVQGKRKYDGHTVHGTKKDAQAYLNAKLRERDLGTYASVRHTLVDALLDDLLADYKINGKDYDWAELNVRVHLRPFFGAMRASTVGTDQIRSYIGERQAKARQTPRSTDPWRFCVAPSTSARWRRLRRLARRHLFRCSRRTMFARDSSSTMTFSRFAAYCRKKSGQ